MRAHWRALDTDTLRVIGLVCLAVVIVGVSYGAVGTQAGLPPWFTVALATTVLAASSELLFVGIVAAGGNPFAAALAGLVVNARHLPYGMAVGEVLGRGWRRYLGAHLLNDETVVLALGQQDRARARAALWVCGLGILVSWPMGALLGAWLGRVVADPAATGLDAVFPAIIIALVLPALRDRRRRTPALAGAVLTLSVTPFVPTGLAPIIALLGLLTLWGRRAP